MASPLKETAVFGGGCFWCTEAVFRALKGVTSVLPGYTGGTTENPTYMEISDGNTGHVEVVKIEFDPAIVKYPTLLTVFFASHDPSTLNRQGNDVGTQYRSVVFYTTPEQKETTEKFIQDTNASNTNGDPIITAIEPLKKFYVAENYHQDYYARNKERGYCQVVINPKLEKIQKEFGDLLAATPLSS
jgi:peptide-methionine (S)-S-oxide reductase